MMSKPDIDLDYGGHSRHPTFDSGQERQQESLEASPGFFDFLVGYTFCSRPGFDGCLAVLGDGLPHDPAGNGISRK